MPEFLSSLEVIESNLGPDLLSSLVSCNVSETARAIARLVLHLPTQFHYIYVIQLITHRYIIQ